MSIKLLKVRRGQEKPAGGGGATEGQKQQAQQEQQQHVLENGAVIACRQNGCCADERLRRLAQQKLHQRLQHDQQAQLQLDRQGRRDYDAQEARCSSSRSPLRSIHEEAAAAEAEEATSATATTTTTSTTKHDDHFRAPLVWTNIFLFVVLHSALPAGLWMVWAQGLPRWQTLLWTLVTTYASGLGVTGGAHRLWSHKAYKARLPVQLLLMALQTMAGQNSIYTWCRDHRVHHKFSETNADPHNIKRGFFFAHMGWLCCRKHPEVRAKGALIDMSDLEANPVVMFQHRHFWWLAILFTVALPTLVPVLLWRESLAVSFVIGFMWRYIISLHGTWLVNSAAHYHGMRPYDEHIEARESPWVIWTCVGEGFHNYHHTFPFDYATSEYGAYFNITTLFIDACARLGLAYDRRKVADSIIAARRARTGDQRHSS